jgi:hypothetical protein
MLAFDAQSWRGESARSLLPVAALVQTVEALGYAESPVRCAAPRSGSFVQMPGGSDESSAVTRSSGPCSQREPLRDASQSYLDHCALLC